MLFPTTEEDLLLKDKLAFDELDRLIVERLSGIFQNKNFDLRKESKLAAALSKALLCKKKNVQFFFKIIIICLDLNKASTERSNIRVKE